MNPVRGIAYEHDTARDEALGDRQRQWIGIAIALKLDFAEESTDGGAKPVEISSIFHRLYPCCVITGLGPDDRTTVTPEWQQRQRSAWHEQLVGGATMGPFMLDGADQCRLPVVPAECIDSRTAGDRAPMAIGANQDRSFYGTSAVKDHPYARIRHFMGDDGLSVNLRYASLLRQRLLQCVYKMAGFQHKTCRALIKFGMIEFQWKRRGTVAGTPVRNDDLEDRLRLVGYTFPYSQSVKQALGCQSQCIAAAVRRWVGLGFVRCPVYDRHACTRSHERQSHRSTVQTATNNHRVASFNHECNMGKGDRIVQGPFWQYHRAHILEAGMCKEWLWMSAGDLGRAIARREIDPVALVRTYLEAIEAHPLGPRIFTRLTPDLALSQAKAASARAVSGFRYSHLDGVPVSWKDLFDTAGITTEAGSKLLAERVPNRDAMVFRNAASAGMVCLGKTHMSELAFSGLGYNPATATPPSVNDEGAVAGGSSSGAAASVAHGLSASAIGSDTGGSVRIPSVWNDLVGLKTTSGRLSLEGVVPLCPNFDTVGPLCRSVEDAALMLAALEGSKPPDLKGANLRGMRFLALRTVALDDIRPEPKAGFDQAVLRLRSAGATIEPKEVPAVVQAMELASLLFTSEAYGIWKDEIERAPEKMFNEVLARFRIGRDHSAADYVAGWKSLCRIRAEWHEATASFDAVILPTAPSIPPNIARLSEDSAYFTTENLFALRNTRIGNLMGSCALTLPTGVPSTGLMLMATPMQEGRLLRIGAAAEAALA